MPRTLQLNASQDIDITYGRATMISGREAIAQHILTRLLAVRGEWFLGRRRVGVPYFDEILVHNPEGALIETIFASTILNTPGVVGLEEITLDVDDARNLLVTFTANTVEGRVTLAQVKLR